MFNSASKCHKRGGGGGVCLCVGVVVVVGGGWFWVLTCRVRVRGWVLTCIIGCNSLFTGRCASNLEGGPGKGG